ncbi:lysylphosphatidylglycerol synthase domain-containing protein [Paenibacillus sp. NFR01]|uniref:lysylphosphatidylglycerol synthase domain-containing protein n=1 Tax=Paenibacillus sp. NFR01 TaxID=1566279 RepID=UPI0008AB432A|nr:lysylphosphatidylglycerol synthase domain-containing protein [Paenibacillus sp. NFR01]SET14758.1 hypothetical protein SAMN03159358_0848 [Paenibacillus sp. NFR01]
MAAARKWAPTVLKAVLIAAIIIFVLRSVPLKAADITDFLIHASGNFYLSIVVFAIFLMLQASIWVLIVNAASSGASALTGKWTGKIGLLPGLSIFVNSQFAKYIPGGIWNYAGRIMLASRAGIPLDAQFAAIVYENILLFSAALTFALMLAVTLHFETVPLLLAASLLLLFTYFFYPRMTAGARGIFIRVSRLKVLKRPLEKLTKPFGQIGTVRSEVLLTRNQFFGYLGCFIANHFIMGIGFWLLVNSFGAGRISIIYAAGTFATSWLIGSFSPLPGGLGVREGFLVYFLSLKLGSEAALQISVIARLWNVLAEVLFWAFIQTATQFRKRVKSYGS